MLIRALLVVITTSVCAFGQDAGGDSGPAPGLVPTEGFLSEPDDSGAWWERAQDGITVGLDAYQLYQDVVDGGFREGSESGTSLDFRATFDLMRMDLVPGAIVTVRAESRFDDSVNGSAGVLLPVNTLSAFPLSTHSDGEVDVAVTEFHWLQFLSEQFAVFFGKVTTIATSNEFMGGEGRTQFMNLQLSWVAAGAQIGGYSVPAIGLVWIPNETWTVSSLIMNNKDASTTSGFSDIGDGAVWAIGADYLASLNGLPGGGYIEFDYGFDSEFARIGGLNIDPGTGISVDSQSSTWAAFWSGWQYLSAEGGSDSVDSRDGRQDLQGLGVFAQLGLADEDTNPVSWSIAGGLSGRGSIPERDDDTWGLGFFYNDLQDLNLGPLVLEDDTSGVEAYYDIALTGSVSLTLDAQWTSSAFSGVDDATILGARLRVSL